MRAMPSGLLRSIVSALSFEFEFEFGFGLGFDSQQ